MPATVAAEILADVRAAGGIERARQKAAALAADAVSGARRPAAFALP